MLVRKAISQAPVEIQQPRDFRGSARILDGRGILVTGATGSLGYRLITTLLKDGKPRRLVVFSRDELKQYDMEQALRDQALDVTPARFFLGDVRDERRLEMAMNGIDTVIHAAALKQIPAAEYNPFECIHTNVLGAENIVRAAIRSGVQKVVALSTDKACSPVNLYGASKLASDKIFIAANNLSGAEGCKFSVVRYGNVMGSRGSVVPLFQRLANNGAEFLPITDPRMTRFWITLDQAVSFVLSCLAVMTGGELFVPKLPSVKITDLAEIIAPDLPQKIVGIRPGEKLHESMITENDARATMELNDRYVLLPRESRDQEDGQFALYGGKKAEEGFVYASNTNSEWLLPEQISRWLAFSCSPVPLK